MRRRWIAVVGVFFFGALSAAGWSLWRQEEIPEDLPNVVLLVLCSTRADQTPMYGLPYDTMPELASLASGGMVFEDGVTAAPWTRPGVTAVLTGAHPATVGMLEPRDIRSDRVLPRSATTLGQRLSDVGYETIGRSANPNIAPIYGFDRGFDDFENLSPAWRGGVEKVRGADVAESLLAAVDARGAPDAPLYLQAVFVDAHQPMSVSVATGHRWLQDDVPVRVGRYRGMLRTLDSAIGRLLSDLADRGLDQDNTVFVVVNDHGEGLRYPRHNGMGHGRYLYPSTTRLIWVMFGRGVAVGRYSGLVSQVDVLPTVLEHLRLPRRDIPDGHSMAGVVGGDVSVPGRQRAYSATMFANTERAAVVTPSANCLLDFGDGRAQQLEADRGKPVFEPHCAMRDGSPMDSASEAALRGELIAWWAEMMERLDEYGAEGVTAPDGAVPQDIEAMLEALGYTEGREGVPRP